MLICYFIKYKMSMNGLNVIKKLNSILYMQQRFCQGPCACIVKCYKWDISEFIMGPSSRYAVLILNRPVQQSMEFMSKFWNNASVRVTVDGGTTQWKKFLNNMPEERQLSMKNPDLVTGDFDSILPEVKEHFTKKIVHTPDQNHTDFTKAIMELNKHIKQEKIQISHVIAVAQNSGRLDHTLGNIQTLFLVKEKNILCPEANVYIMSDDSISWLLYPGDHIISIPEVVRQHKRAWCSLVPVGEACLSVTSSGLKWNLVNQSLKFGDIVSTSNTFDGSEVVKIKCSHPILWSMRIPMVK
ncbi:thiamin pyrophosphokinase 1 isoform X2 [Plodia interpunctella]|uniref:thiamin pyrophosphokinase 1 isoform X2 n=1 Tax=Plodia interpunctella TaxID=58824 RepID=UPI00236786BD|nr:thiamin pyrophosphokinase 1 isoform X2 [Plodia interpunctella]